MIVDKSHAGWALVAVGSAVAAAIAAPETGGSVAGIVVGSGALACMLFCAALTPRKKVPHWRLGRAAWWLRGHIWLGVLSLPLALIHSGFSFGGPLSAWSMALLVAVFATGLLGLALQQFLPRLMTRNLPQETVYEQIDHVRARLLEDARALAAGEGGRGAGKKSGGAISGRVVRSRAAVETEVDRTALQRFVKDHVEPFFEGREDAALWSVHRRAAMFHELRLALPPELHDTTRDLEALCEEREQLETQRKLHHWLHGWLLVHVPLSFAVLVLVVIHAVVSLGY